MGSVVSIPSMENLLTAGQAAQLMNVSTSYIRRLRNAGYLEDVGRIGSVVLYDRASIMTYIADHPRLGKNRYIV